MEAIRLLLVDDEVDFCSTLAARLKRRDFEVVQAENGRQALETLKTRDIDVAIIDVKMPLMDGFETLRRIRERSPLLEVIMLTGHASVESGVEGIRLGAFDYVVKPCNIDDLIGKIRDAYQRKLAREGTPR